MALSSNKFSRIFFSPILLLILMLIGHFSFCQEKPGSRYGINDTLIVPFVVYNGDTIPARELELCWVTAPMPAAMRERLREWTRLRNAVYVTYPYARKAGVILNDMNAKMANMPM